MKKIIILVIDDSAIIANDIIRILNISLPGNSIDKAYTLEAAINFLKKIEYDLVILDGNLDQGNHGRQILANMSPEQIAKTVVYSGENDFIKECENNGIFAFDKIHDFSEVLPLVISARNLFK